MPSLNTVYTIRKNNVEVKYQLKTVSYNNPEYLADVVFIFHNPNAKHKLHEELFSAIPVTQFFFNDGNLNYMGNAASLVARYNTSSLLAMISEPYIMKQIRLYNRLSINEYYDFVEEQYTLSDILYLYVLTKISTTSTHSYSTSIFHAQKKRSETTGTNLMPRPLMKCFRMPQHKTIAKFNFSWRPCLNQQTVYMLDTCKFVRSGSDSSQRSCTLKFLKFGGCFLNICSRKRITNKQLFNYGVQDMLKNLDVAAYKVVKISHKKENNS